MKKIKNIAVIFMMAIVLLMPCNVMAEENITERGPATTTPYYYKTFTGSTTETGNYSFRLRIQCVRTETTAGSIITYILESARPVSIGSENGNATISVYDVGASGTAGTAYPNGELKVKFKYVVKVNGNVVSRPEEYRYMSIKGDTVY